MQNLSDPSSLNHEIEKWFFHQNTLDLSSTQKIVEHALAGREDGELFLEYGQSESFVYEQQCLRSSNAKTIQGMGLRAVQGEMTGFAHTSHLSKEALEYAVKSVKSLPHSSVNCDFYMPSSVSHNKAITPLYSSLNPISGHEFSEKITLLEKIDRYIREKNSHVIHVSLSLVGSLQKIYVMRPYELGRGDIRPLVRLNITVTLEKEGKRERGSYGFGGRVMYDTCFDEKKWMFAAEEALRMALLNMDAVPSPAGEMPVVLGAGWPGILLHEAVGHGLEGDFNRKKTSAFTEKMGKRVAAEGVTIVDNGTLPDARGSLTIDDEGTPTESTILIEDGILVNYMQDRLNARLMGRKPTGNGRRESYACLPMPRMTNTYMLQGDVSEKDMIASVKKGIFAVNFGGGQVDITSGKFVFSSSEAYKIEDGKITVPVKNATLIGDGPRALTQIKAIGNNMRLDPGVGTCGKDGQSVPVGVGQPSLLIEGLTVGGTEI